MRKQLNRVISAITGLAIVGSMLLSVSPAMAAASITSMSDTMTRLKASVTAVSHTISFTLPAGTFSGTFLVVLDAGTAFTSVATDTSALAVTGCNTFTNWGFSSGSATNTLSVVGTTCAGKVTIGVNATNPSSTGSTKGFIFACTDANVCTTLANAQANATDAGTYAVAIVTDDQVSVTATVDPTITFVVGASTTACSNAFATNGGTVALGTLTTASITSSDVASVNHICSLVNTNATAGYAITVKSLNASLKSTSTPGDTIPSATASVNPGVANYGICAGSASTDFGIDTTTPAGSSATSTSPFNTNCTNVASPQSVGALTTSAQTILSNTGPVSGSFATYRIKAAISATIKAHSDYTDTLTFVATGTF